jgi:hypothetical protein
MLQDWVKKALGVLVGVVVLYAIALIVDNVELGTGFVAIVSFTLMAFIGTLSLFLVLVLLVDLMCSDFGGRLK